MRIRTLGTGPYRHIALSGTREADGRIAISVSDNGPGLTLVRQIAAAHGASVDISDTPGGGATVRLRF